ncbi:hypothetical protein [uncultured Nisaea sp.]|uniref:hypothetical protein n=1 Tax=uncultured Nisaea sp. TaxID=538215 RepID=UPI0030EC8915|tara:strand:+ start:302 stop:910 length:609 start_codon:yes stop_codon:yes gene_type:complete
MRDWFKRLSGFDSVVSLGSAAIAVATWAVANVTFVREVWFYLDQAAQIEGDWIYILFAFYNLASVAVVVWAIRRLAVFAVKRVWPERFSAHLYDQDDVHLNQIRSDVLRLLDLLSDFSDPLLQKERVIDLLLAVDGSDHRVWLDPKARQARKDFLHWCEVAFEQRVRNGPAFRELSEREEIIGSIRDASDRIAAAIGEKRIA